MELSSRQGAVLRAVVERYVASAAPVASEVLVRTDFPHISSATLRHDLAALEDAGLIYQPHTSAGRIPSEEGYRFFVEHLLPDRGLTPEEQRTILHQFSQIEDQIDEWLRLASAALAAASGVAAIVSGATTETVRLRHLDLVQLEGRRALIVAVTSDANVLQRILDVAESPTPDALRAEATRLRVKWSDLTVAGLTAMEGRAGEPRRGLESVVREALIGMLQRHEHRQWDIRFHDGLANVLSQPEFLRPVDDRARAYRLRTLITLVEHGGAVRALLPEVVQQGSIRVLIGEQYPVELRDYALVLCPYGGDGATFGVLGLIGPTRLDYPRAINSVRYVAGILGALMHESVGTYRAAAT